MNTQKTIVLAVCLGFSSGPPAAQEGMVIPDTDPELTALLSTLEEATAIATRNRMNADYIPGIVTVLKGDDLEALGAATVWDALRLTPGVQTTRNNLGEPLVLVRGIGNTLNSGNIKILLNSVPMNNDVDGHAFPVMTIPVELVERIEVIRGPGSALHGEYAFSGVINVITRQGDRRVYGRAGRYQTYGAGGMFWWEDEQTGLDLFANLSGWETEGTGLDSGPDRYSDQGLGFAPGPIDDPEGNRTAILGLGYRDYRMMLQYIRREMGDWFGLGALSSPADRDEGEMEQWTLSLSKEWTLSQELDLAAQAYWQSYDFTAAKQLVAPAGAPPLPRPLESVSSELPPPAGDEPDNAPPPPGSRRPVPPGAPPPPIQGAPAIPPPPTDAPQPVLPGLSPRFLPEALTIQKTADTRRYGLDLELSWTGWDDHRWLLGLGYSHVELRDSRINDGSEHGRETFLLPGADRKHYNLTLQDQWRIGESLELTGGLRYDDYDDAGDNLSPRIAAVWRVDDHHILKGQYAEAFRPPTFTELYDNSVRGRNLNPERVATTELAYIYRAPGTRAQITLFHSEIEDLIARSDPSDIFVNRGEVRLRGVETELEKSLGSAWKLTANLSYNDTLDRETDQPVGGSAEWIANLALRGELLPDLVLSAWWQYQGNRAGSAIFPGGELDDISILDLTLNAFDLLTKGLTLRTGVHNLFDNRYAALNLGSYEENLPQPGRAWWVQLSYDFR